MPIAIQHLIHDRPRPVSVEPGTTLVEAIQLMLEHDYSQLPVEEQGRPYGSPATMINGESITRAVCMFNVPPQQLHVRDAVVTARTVRADEDLFTKMDVLLESYAVLVLGRDGGIVGIVTNYDTTKYFRHRAEDMLLVEDIESTLKDHIRYAFGADSDNGVRLQAAVSAIRMPSSAIRDRCRSSFKKFARQKNIDISYDDIATTVDSQFETPESIRSFDDLSLADYIQLARNKEAWEQLRSIFEISDPAFTEMLEGVRKTRNKLMHFRPDIEMLERERLRFCAEWFKNHPPRFEIGVTPLSEGIDSDSSSQESAEIELGIPLGSEQAEQDPVTEKYSLLAAFLEQQSRSVRRVPLTFAEIENVLGDTLPEAALEHRSWWSNDSEAHPHAEQWLRVNWRIVSVSMTARKVLFGRAEDREKAYIKFFTAVQKRLRELGKLQLHDYRPIGHNWLPLCRYAESGQTLALYFPRGKRLRMETYIDTEDGDLNDRVFDTLLSKKDLIEEIVGAPLSWERMEGRRASRVALYTNGGIDDGEEAQRKLVEWVAKYAPPFDQAIRRATEGVRRR